MRTSLALAVFMAVTLTACGGGGSSSSTPVATATATPATSPLSTQETAEVGTEAALTPVETSDSETGTIGGINYPTLSIGRSVMSAPTCNNRHIFIKTSLSPTQTQTEHKYFYDAACTELARDVVAIITQISTSTLSVTRTATTYNLAAAVISTRDDAFTITGSANNYSAVHTSQLFVGVSAGVKLTHPAG